MPAPPQQAMDGWRSQPPECMEKFKLIDEAVGTLIYESSYVDAPQKVGRIASFGLSKLMGGDESYFRFSVRFDPSDGDDVRSKVTIIGTAHPTTRVALGQFAAQNGGPIGTSYGYQP
jgi:hypothetical protein